MVTPSEWLTQEQLDGLEKMVALDSRFCTVSRASSIIRPSTP